MLKLDKIFDDVLKANNGKADTALIVVLNEDTDRSQVVIAGVDKLMIGTKALALTRILLDILSTKLSKAVDVLEVMDLAALEHEEETEHLVSHLNGDADDEDEDEADELYAQKMKEALEGLANLLLNIVKD